MWWGIWGFVTLIGFLFSELESLLLVGAVMKYIGVAALMILAINWLNSTNRGGK